MDEEGSAIAEAQTEQPQAQAPTRATAEMKWFALNAGYVATLWCRCGRRLYTTMGECPRCRTPLPKLFAAWKNGEGTVFRPPEARRKPQLMAAGGAKTADEPSRAEEKPNLKRRLVPTLAVAGLAAATFVVIAMFRSRHPSGEGGHPVLQARSAELTSRAGRFLVEALVENPSRKVQEGILAARFLDTSGREVFTARASAMKFPPGETTAFLAADNHPDVSVAEVWMERGK